MSGRHVGKPPHFSEERVDSDLQAFDVEVLRKIKFLDPDLNAPFRHYRQGAVPFDFFEGF